jgi:hypothetical protein
VSEDKPLDAAPDSFWDPTTPLPEPPSLPANAPSALARLGPSPFPKSGFPFLGFLDTVYEHVAGHVLPDRQSSVSR